MSLSVCVCVCVRVSPAVLLATSLTMSASYLSHTKSFFFSCVSCSPSLRFLLPFRLEWSWMGSLWSGRVVGRGEKENRRWMRWRGKWALSSASLACALYACFLCLLLGVCVCVCLLLYVLLVSFCLRWVSHSAWGECFLLLVAKSVAKSWPKIKCYIKKH